MMPEGKIIPAKMKKVRKAYCPLKTGNPQPAAYQPKNNDILPTVEKNIDFARSLHIGFNIKEFLQAELSFVIGKAVKQMVNIN